MPPRVRTLFGIGAMTSSSSSSEELNSEKSDNSLSVSVDDIISLLSAEKKNDKKIYK